MIPIATMEFPNQLQILGQMGRIAKAYFGVKGICTCGMLYTEDCPSHVNCWRSNYTIVNAIKSVLSDRYFKIMKRPTMDTDIIFADHNNNGMMRQVKFADIVSFWDCKERIFPYCNGDVTNNDVIINHGLLYFQLVVIRNTYKFITLDDIKIDYNLVKNANYLIMQYHSYKFHGIDRNSIRMASEMYLEEHKKICDDITAEECQERCVIDFKF